MKRLLALTITLFLFFVFSSPAMSQSPPGQASSGYGSSENYISENMSTSWFRPGYTKYERGSGLLGTKYYYYIPRVLKDGRQAPAVILLHGMFMLAPEIYQRLIEHLVYQGYIVIFPTMNRWLPATMLEFDQHIFLNRAVDLTNQAISRINSRTHRNISINMNEIYIYGHSLGGLIGLSWASVSGAPAVNAMVLANPCLDASEGNPVPIPIKEIDYQSRAPLTTCRVIILTGDDDTIAPSHQAVAAYDALINAASRVVYQFRTDAYGRPDLKADHNAGMTNSGFIPSGLMEFIAGGDGNLDALDWRGYWAALDATMDGQTDVTFDMGSWSNGTPVLPPVQMAP